MLLAGEVNHILAGDNMRSVMPGRDTRHDVKAYSYAEAQKPSHITPEKCDRDAAFMLRALRYGDIIVYRRFLLSLPRHGYKSSSFIVPHFGIDNHRPGRMGMK